MENSNSNAQPARKTSRRKKVLALVVTVAVLGYLALVLLTSFQKTICIYPRIDPVILKRCKPIYQEMALTPYADKNFAQFREYGNIWLLDSAKTSMYRVELLSHPDCFVGEVNASMHHKKRHYIVLFDVEKNREVLVITNR